MAGNKTIFQDSLRKAHNFAWDKKWPQAIAEYRRALAEIDNDAVVWVSLGVALLEAKRLTEAKDAYRRASDLQPGDLATQQKLAEIYERAGDIENALQTYLQVATAFQKSDTPAKAIDAWRAILKLQPAHLDSHEHLASLFAQLHRNAEAAQEYITLARLLRERGRIEDASGNARKALSLDPRNGEARTFIESLQLTTSDGYGAPPALSPQVPISEDAIPMQQAAQLAMERLANSIFEPGQSREASTFISQAVDFQTRAKTREASESYQRALASGASQPEIHFNLGVLYLSALQLDEATQEFSQLLDLPDYAVGSHFALGQIYRTRGSIYEAITHLLEVIKLVDVPSVKPAEADQLLQLYQGLAQSYRALQDGATLATFADALLAFMSDKQWLEKIKEFRQRLDEVADHDELMPIAELLGTADPEQVLVALGTSKEHLKRQRFTAAIEECYHAIALAPTYLPLHTRLAEAFVHQGRIEAAAGKYQMIAALQHVRGEVWQATRTYRHILELSPQDVEVRAQLINMLSEQGAIDEVIEQRLALGEVYYQLAQLERALTEYQEAVRLIPRAAQDRWSDTILHLIGDIYVQRASWKDALTIYLQIRKLAPHDSKASLRLIELYSKLGREPEMENELAHLLDVYKQAGESAALISVVSDMVALRPKNSILRNHLIDLLITAGRTEQAISELDALGELELSVGRMTEAITTIERIIALNPRNVESYRELLAQLREGQ